MTTEQDDMRIKHASTPFNRTDDLEAVAAAARKARQAQRNYYADRSAANLRLAQRAEKELDNALAALDLTGAGMRPLFPLAGP